MKKSLFIVALLFLFCIAKINAQDHVNYNLYIQNPTLYNPANLFDGYKYSAYLNSHIQMVGFDGAPRTNAFGINGKLAENMGLGFVGYQSKQGLNTQTNLNLGYAYRAIFADDNYLNMGLNLGAYFEGFDYTGVQYADFTDDWFLINGNKSASFAARFGAQYFIKNFEIGIAMPELYQKKSLNLHTLGIFAYNWQVNDFLFKPSLLVRYAKYTKLQYDVNFGATWKKLIQFQLGYRSEKNVVAILGLKLGDYNIAYAYQFDFADVPKISTGTHEIQISYQLPFREKKPQDHKYDCQCCYCVAKRNGTIECNQGEKVEVPNNDDKIELQILMKDKKYVNAIKGNIYILKDGKVIETYTADDKGEKNIYLSPDKYEINIKAKGYLPIRDTLSFTENEKGTKKVYSLEPEKLEEGLVFSFNSIEFETGSAKIASSAYSTLDLLVEIFTDNPNLVVEIAGHTDNTGTEEANTRVSEKRAIAVGDYFISKGVKPEQFITKGYGSAKPTTTNDTEEGRAKNRRVEFTVTKI